MSDEIEQKTLYIFIDESGNFDFTPKGTKYFVLTAASTVAPLKDRDELLKRVHELKYAGWNLGQSDYCFHATEDKQEVRDWVFNAIKELVDVEVDAIVAQKNKTNPSLYIQYVPSKKASDFFGVKPVRSEEKFYDKISKMLLQYIFRRYEKQDEIGKIVVVLGSLFTGAKRKYVLKSLKQYFKTFNKPFYIYFHSTSSEINCQIADYCGWAVFVKYERGEGRPLQEIQDKIKSNFDVFSLGTTEYYAYKK